METSVPVETPTVAPPNTLPPMIPEPLPGPRVLNGGWATAVLGVYLGAQMIGGLMAGIFAAFTMGFQGGKAGAEDYKAAVQDIMPLTIFLVMLFGGIAVVWSSVGLKFQLKDTSPTGAAWVRGSWGNIAAGLGVGVLGGVLWAVFTSWFPHPTSEELGPLARMGVTGGFPQIAWMVVALFLAPPTEELLFRGILFGGYSKSMGALPAGVLTTFIFVALHFSELIYQPLATFAIGGLAVAALAFRIRSNAIGPAIAVHFGYNAMIAVMAICFN